LIVLFRPACFAVLLPIHGRVGVELLGPPALFDALVVLAAVTLARCFGEAGIDDAAFTGDVALGFEMEVEGFEVLAAPLASILFEALLEVPDRLLSGITSPMRRPRKLLKLVRSKICSSVASSLSPWNFCSTSTLSMSTGSKGGLPPLLQSRVA
jgi:hypothetical protein